MGADRGPGQLIPSLLSLLRRYFNFFGDGLRDAADPYK